MNTLSLPRINSTPFKAKNAGSVASNERKIAYNMAAYKKFYKQYNIAKLIEAIEETSKIMTQMMHEKKEKEVAQQKDA
jgi:hypothetical protein